MNAFCDKSCPTYTESSYLLERNSIDTSSDVFTQGKESISYCENVLSQAEGKLLVVPSKSTADLANNLTYCAVCHNWKGSQLRCAVYNLKFYHYLELVKKSWSNTTNTTELDYMNIFAKKAKVLIISNLDYVNFKNFECQTLLQLIQARNNLSTILITPPISSLVGEGPFFGNLSEQLRRSVIK
jgi:hypothetical protein